MHHPPLFLSHTWVGSVGLASASGSPWSCAPYPGTRSSTGLCWVGGSGGGRGLVLVGGRGYVG